MTEAPVFRDREEQRLFLRAAGLASFFDFVRTFGSPVRQGGDISIHTHKPICDFASDDSIKRKAIAMPRKLRKTTILDRWYPIWCYLRDHEERILLGAETLDIASQSMDWIKDTLMGNSLLRWCYPEIAFSEAYTNKHKWSGVAINLPREGTYAEPTFKAMGVGGAGQSRHFTRLCLTDIFGEKGMNSEPVRLKTLSWWDGLPALLLDSVTGVINLDFTFWAIGDPHCYYMDTHPEYHWRIVPALRVDDATAERGRRGNRNTVIIQHPDAELLTTNFPDIVFEEGERGPTGKPKFPTEEYIRMMKSSEEERIFWTQHMNMPEMADSSMNTFLAEWLRTYHIERGEDGTPWVFLDDKSGDAFPVAKVQSYGFIDPGGFSESPLKGGRCAAMVVGRAPKGRKTIILWTWAKRILRPSDLMKAVFDAQDKFKPRCWRIETTAQQRYIFRDLQEENTRNNAGLHILEYEIRDTSPNAKDNRIVSLKGPGENGEIYYQESMADFFHEWKAHPVGITKDLLDCLSMYYAVYGTGVTAAPARKIIKDRYRAYLDTKARAWAGR